MFPPRLPAFRQVFHSLALAAAILIPHPTSAQSTQDPGRTTILTHMQRSLANAVVTGALPASQPLQLTLTLTPTPDRIAALDQSLTALADPTSASYHKWITPDVFASTYGATPDQVAAITMWAQSQGLTVGALSAGGTRLPLTGTTAQVQIAFAVSLHTYQLSGATHFATPDQPSIPTALASSITAIAGLDDLTTAFADAAATVDANTTAILPLASTACSADFTDSQTAQYRLLFRQAAAQGISVIATSGCGSTGSFPASLPEVTALTLTGTANDTDPTAARPTWQSAPGLPANGLRVEPDLTSPDLDAFAQAITTIQQQASTRLGNLNAALYKIAPIPGLYTQPDAPTINGTWETPTGLGTVNLQQLIEVFPRGVGSSYTSFSATNYAPTHGQNITLSSTITSGTGGRIPTGTVSFVTSTGATLGTATLDNTGTGSLTTNALPGGSTQVTAQYSGDATYAPSASGAATISVQPEASQLAATVSTGNIVGGSYTVTVTDTVTYGQPTGPITVNVLNTNYTGTLAAASSTSSAVTITIPASTVGTATLSINCTATPSYSCYNPVTTTVTIGKATPTLIWNYTPNPVTSGATVSLTASLAAVGTAPVPTGNVEFHDNSTLLNAGTLTNGATSTSGVVTSASTHAISATYDGDANYLTVTSTTPGSGKTTGIPTATSAPTFSPSSPTYGAAISLSSTVTSTAGGGSPTGSVQFLAGTTVLCTGTLAGSVATCTVTTPPPVGTLVVTASYSGDTNFASSVSTSTAITITPAVVASSITLTASTSSTLAGSVITFTAQVTGRSPAGALPTSLVSFYDNTANIPILLGTATLSSSANALVATATFLTSSLSAGTHTISAVYAGDANFTTVTSSTVSVTIADYTAGFSPTTLTIAQGGTGSAVLTIAAQGGFTGTVALACTPTPNTAIMCSFSSPTITSPGSSTLTVTTTPASAKSSLQPVAGTITVALLLTITLPGRRRRLRLIPTLLLVLVALGLTANLGCASTNVASTNTSLGGTPFGTTLLTITTAGTSGIGTVRHTFAYQVTVQ